jgi:hypothetical protein
MATHQALNRAALAEFATKRVSGEAAEADRPVQLEELMAAFVGRAV